MFIYFIFCGYRVAIGRTSNLHERLRQYRRSHFTVEVLGVISFEDTKVMLSKEREILKQFSKDRAFRDMFYLSSEMLDFIVSDTIPCTEKMIKDSHNIVLENKKEYKQRPEVKERRRRYSKEVYRKKISKEW